MSWLDELKIGDKVIVRNHWRTDIARVVRITKTLVIVNISGTENKFSRKDGNEVPYPRDSLYSTKLKAWDEDQEKQILLDKKHKDNRYRFQDLKPTNTEIEIMLNALDEFNSKNNEEIENIDLFRGEQ